MIEAGRSVEFRVAWWNAIETYYTYNRKKRDMMEKFHVKRDTREN